MAIHTLFRRWRTGSIASIEAESRGRAVELAARSGITLAYADLKRCEASLCSLPDTDFRGADLDGASLPLANLRRADFRTATLIEANLVSADLRQADLRNATLRNVDFRNADLRDALFVGADLRGARLTGARLDGARLDWRWAAFAIELLCRDSGCKGDALPLIVELAFERDERPYAWLRPLLHKPHLLGWVASVLGRAVHTGDGAPEILRTLADDVDPSALHDPIPVPDESTERLYWTRPVNPRRVRLISNQ
ncbi:pentapeptide repeat-containing protein [Paludisphaera mucosa]|uniref:Pentapeptide repeat-containing protein n=1 Tax=Paludisphaera mucosa TaxID=3030827 RepID=A0ABT6FDP4_9BACT|nr:pentapeptide repeat-containing protein [Paludisphaera mucosa]MDG3005485.1 pentapeptide repeat-containing protein [Paludisphaera mucosa]